MSAIQYGEALDRLITYVIIDYPALGPIHVLKADISESFYYIGLRPTDALKLGIVSLSEVEDKESVAIPLTLPVGWKNSPPIFFSETETVTGLVNTDVYCNSLAVTHMLDDREEAIVREEPSTLQSELAGLMIDLYLRQANAKTDAYVNFFIDGFLGLVQETVHRWRLVQRTLFRSLNKVFQTCDSGDSDNYKEVLLLNKLRAGKFTWSTYQFLMAWLKQTVNMTLSLPSHRENRFRYILAEIPTNQKRIGVDKWYLVIEEICSMDVALPGAQGLFSHMQEAIRQVEGKRVVLTRVIHQALTEFQWLAEVLSDSPTIMYELVPLQPMLDGYHNDSGYECGGGVLPVPKAVPWTPQPQPSSVATPLEPTGSHSIV